MASSNVLRSKYVPQYTNTASSYGQPLYPEPKSYVPSESMAQNSSTSTDRIKVNLDELQQLPGSGETVTTGGGNLMRRRTLILAVTLVCLLVVASVAPAVVYSIETNNNDDSTTSTSTTTMFFNTTSTTATTETTTTATTSTSTSTTSSTTSTSTSSTSTTATTTTTTATTTTTTKTTSTTTSTATTTTTTTTATTSTTTSTATTTSTTTTTTTSTTTTTTSTTTTTTTSTTSTTSSTTTSTTTTVMNPCLLGTLRWNTTGITVLNSTYTSHASDIFFDSNDTLYIIDEYPDSDVWKLPKNAVVPSLIAGIPQSLGSNATQLNYPQGVYVDSKQNLYVSDYYNYRVQKYVNGSTNGITIAGITGSSGAALNQFAGLRYFWLDSTETYMYITDCDNHRIMRYPLNSTTGTNGTIAAGGTGVGNTNTQLNYPWGIYSVPSISNYIYITNCYGHSVSKWAPGASSGIFVAGSPGVAGSSSTLLNGPMGIRLDANLNMYVVDNSNHRVQMFCYNNLTGTTVAGNGTAGSSATQLNFPRGIAFDSSMNMYITDQNNARIQKFIKF